MSLFKQKSELDEQLSQQAQKLGISVEELKKLYVGKTCPKYGNKEILHVRKNRKGILMAFNISEKFRGEKISTKRKKAKPSA